MAKKKSANQEVCQKKARLDFNQRAAATLKQITG
jgi:hypothetical protein